MSRLTWILFIFSVGVAVTLGTLGMTLAKTTRTLAADDKVQHPARSDSDDPNPAVNETDKLAWEVFVKINSPVKNGTNDAIWETWATDQDTFPEKPDPKNPPVWPGKASRKKALQPSHQQILRRKLLEGSPHHQFLQEIGRGIPVLPKMIAGGEEEIRRNKPDFEFIVKNNLWFLEGLQAAFNKGDPISFPVAAIEIKAKWKPITEGEKPSYHWNVDNSNKLFGLTALHIMTKDLPNWVWATWEHLDNPDRCKILGCHDSFGVTNNGKVSPALKALLKQAGMGPDWENYRLDGAQIDFTDPTGRPTLLANSIIEHGFVATSSCITCHARATFDATGRPLAIFRPDGQSYSGTPDPNWFYTSTNPPKTLYLQGDFVWSFLLASPAKPSQ